MSSFIVMHPDPIQRVRLALEDIRAGRMVVLVDDEDRENEGDLVCASEAVTPEIINFMAKYGRGLICLTLTEERVRQLGLPMMAANNQSPYHTAFTVSIEARQGVTTGISAADRAQTCKAAIAPSAGPQDLVTPGHIFPLRARNGGVLVRTGQTEGSVDLARLAGLTPSGVICEIMNDDGTMARLPDLLKFGEEHSIRIVTVADIIRWRIRHEVLVERVSSAPLQTPFGVFQHRTYRSETDEGVHMVLWQGDVTGDEPVLTRVQSFCPTSDIFGSSTCEGRAQLEASLSRIAEEGRGVFLYLHVAGEKHVSSVVSRMRAHLGESEIQTGDKSGGELRELGTGAQILRDLGVRRLTLLTNNPRKIVGLEGYGLEVVDQRPIRVPVPPENAQNLAEHRDESAHLLPADAVAQS
jgi:3,4-dihydroxy 2-butanone 4-phosphate synthase/GTP cyclohydrolase II